MTKSKDQSCRILIGGFAVDVFICDEGDLGLTVENIAKRNREVDPNCVDIIDINIDKDTLKVSSDGIPSTTSEYDIGLSQDMQS